MKLIDNYLDINKKLWNEKVPHHVASDFYNMSSFLDGKSSLKPIELNLLGDIKGQKVLHLQCHFGQDTISLSRMGASTVGVDFSEVAIEKANEIAIQCGVDARFICTDVYNLSNVLNEQFDLVFTSYGTIGWLPDLDLWAGEVANFLKPKGRFIIVDFHPFVWMFDNEFSHIQYPYFNKEAIIETLSGTYADRNAPIQQSEIGWNHSFSEILNALLAKGLLLNHFGEYDYSPYNCFKNMEEFETGKFRIAHLENKMPMVYSIVMFK